MRLKKIILSLALSCVCSPLLKAQVQEAIPYKVNVDEFHELLVLQGINVNYKSVPDSAGMVVFRATPEMTSRILFSNPSGKLKIELSEEVKKNVPDNLPTVTVYSSYLTKVENRGDSTVNILSNRPGPFMKARLEGNGKIGVYDTHVTTFEASIGHSHGDIIATGVCKDAKLSITGKGKIYAYDLKATNVRCNLFGAGEVRCLVADGELVVQGISSATVYYKGKPLNIKKRSTGVKLIAVDEETASDQQ